jgi:hypothetical protein
VTAGRTKITGRCAFFKYGGARLERASQCKRAWSDLARSAILWMPRSHASSSSFRAFKAESSARRSSRAQRYGLTCVRLLALAENGMAETVRFRVEGLPPIQTSREFWIAVLVASESYVVAHERTGGWLAVDEQLLSFDDGLPAACDRRWKLIAERCVELRP